MQRIIKKNMLNGKIGLVFELKVSPKMGKIIILS